MIEVSEANLKTITRQSSKGNQLKWEKDGTWYKADYTGYEGLAEYVISQLLKKSSLSEKEYVIYRTQKIGYKQTDYLGCQSPDFMQEGRQLIALERLFMNFYGESLTKTIYHIPDMKKRISFVTEQIIRITGLKDFGLYLNKLLTIDAFFLNEDRHMHNIAVLVNEAGEYDYCPIFDNGAALMADTTMDYPMSGELYNMIKSVKSKTFFEDFDGQLDAAEELYGRNLTFCFTKKDVEDILKEEKLYPEEIKNRVRDVLFYQMAKYQYLFVR